MVEEIDYDFENLKKKNNNMNSLINKKCFLKSNLFEKIEI